MKNTIQLLRNNGTYVTRSLSANATIEDVVCIVNATLGRHLAVRHTPWYKRLLARLRSPKKAA